MLRNLGIRSKLLAVLAVPMLVLVIGASRGLAAGSQRRKGCSTGAAPSGRRAQLLRARSPPCRPSAACLRRKLSGDYTLGGQLRTIRKQTDSAAAVHGRADRPDRPGQAAPTRRPRPSPPTCRPAPGSPPCASQVDKGTISPAACAGVYSAAIAEEIQIPARIAASLSDRTLAVPAALLLRARARRRARHPGARPRSPGPQRPRRRRGSTPQPSPGRTTPSRPTGTTRRSAERAR